MLASYGPKISPRQPLYNPQASHNRLSLPSARRCGFSAQSIPLPYEKQPRTQLRTWRRRDNATIGEPKFSALKDPLSYSRSQVFCHLQKGNTTVKDSMISTLEIYTPIHLTREFSVNKSFPPPTLLLPGTPPLKSPPSSQPPTLQIRPLFPSADISPPRLNILHHSTSFLPGPFVSLLRSNVLHHSTSFLPTPFVSAPHLPHPSDIPNSHSPLQIDNKPTNRTHLDSFHNFPPTYFPFWAASVEILP